MPGAPLDAAGLALDSRSLERLKAQARQDARGTARAAAKQFEAVFLNQLLKQMRESLPDTDPFSSQATKMQTALFDQHLAARLAERGTGLGEAIAKYLERLLPAATPAGTTGEAGAASAAAKASPALPANAARGAIRPAAVTAPAAKATLAPLPDHGAGAAIAKPVAAKSAAADGTKSGFLDTVLTHAQRAAQILGVPAAYIVGQAAHESAWGKREIVASDGTRSHNLFGIKAGANWKGATVDAVTTEVVGGVARRVVQKFRAYGSLEEGFADYAKLLASSPRYAKGVVGAPDAASFARALAAGGYATDPQYAAKLERVIAAAQAAERGA